MKFKDWVLLENTISQIIKQKYKDKYKKMYKPIHAYVKTNIENLSDDSYDILTKWYSFNYFRYLIDNDLEESSSSYRSFFYAGDESIAVRHRDYLTSKVDEKGNFENRLKSKFNDPNFWIGDLDTQVELWHTSLESKSRMPGADGEVILDLSNSIEPKNVSLLKGGWEGWKWVDLRKGYCDKESKSMGHCGNSGALLGDTILSLRDQNNIPHLTFILNGGNLGQMKGRNNNKPSEKYHPAIVELLKLPIIKQVVGGGYKPENNFSLNDLDEEIKDQLIELKPDLEFDVYKDLEEKMEKIRDEYNVKDWTFASEYSSLEYNDESPTIYCSGGFYTTIKFKLIKELPKDWRGWSNLKQKIRSTINRFSIEDIEFQETKNGLNINGNISYEAYGSEIDNFEEYIRHLSEDVEPYEEEFKNLIQRILVEEGYVAPYYIKRVGNDKGKVFWSNQKFKNFDWDVTDEFKSRKNNYSHEISVKIFNYLNLGSIKNKNKTLYKLQVSDELQKDLENELVKISSMVWSQDLKQGRLFKTHNLPAYTEDMKIKPSLNVSVHSDREDYRSAWDPEKNPVVSFDFKLNGYVEIFQVNTYDEAKKAERMLHFIDNNYELIKRRLIQVFNSHIPKIEAKYFVH